MGQIPMKITTCNLSKNNECNSYDAKIYSHKILLKAGASYVVFVNSGVFVTCCKIACHSETVIETLIRK